MTSNESSKLVLLYILQILWSKTDDSHSISTAEIINHLNYVYGIEIERKRLYRDIETLEDFGFHIEHIKGHSFGYRLVERNIGFTDILLLSKAIETASGISYSHSKELIEKIGKLGSDYEKKKIMSSIILQDRPKTHNNWMKYILSDVYQAIYEDNQLSFQPLHWNIRGELEIDSDTPFRIISPWYIIWDGSYYYVLGCDDIENNHVYYRLDLVRNTEVLPIQRLGKKKFEHFNPISYVQETINLQEGHKEYLLLRGEQSIMGDFFDRFGKEKLMIRPDGDNHFKLRISMTIHKDFFAWIASFGGKVIILSPESVRIEYKKFLLGILQEYQVDILS